MIKRFAILCCISLFLTGNGNCIAQSNDSIYIVVEQMPSFPGGEAEMNRFIYENLKLSPVSLKENALITRMTAKFVVTKTGRIENIQNIKGGIFCDSLISVIKRMPDWIPGKHNGENVSVYYTLPLHIRLKE